MRTIIQVFALQVLGLVLNKQQDAGHAKEALEGVT